MPNSTDKNSDKDNLMNNKKIKQNMRQVDKSIGQLNMSLYGTDRNEEIDGDLPTPAKDSGKLIESISVNNDENGENSFDYTVL